MVLMLAITVGGIFVVSAFIGVLTAGLEGKIADLRKGRSKVVERGHTVVLGWSEQVFTVVSELVQANHSNRRSCIAILADKDKVEMEDALRARGRRPRADGRRLPDREPARGRPIWTWSTWPTARSVMVLPPPVEDADIQVIKILPALGNRAPVVVRRSWPRSTIPTTSLRHSWPVDRGRSCRRATTSRCG